MCRRLDKPLRHPSPQGSAKETSSPARKASALLQRPSRSRPISEPSNRYSPTPTSCRPERKQPNGSSLGGLQRAALLSRGYLPQPEDPFASCCGNSFTIRREG